MRARISEIIRQTMWHRNIVRAELINQVRAIKGSLMTTVFFIVALVVAAWIFAGIVKRSRFRKRALRVIREDLCYDAAIPGHQSALLNQLSSRVHVHGGNEYDAAMAFMLTQLAMLSKPLTTETRGFTREKIKLLRGIATKAVHPEILDDFLTSQRLT